MTGVPRLILRRLQYALQQKMDGVSEEQVIICIEPPLLALNFIAPLMFIITPGEVTTYEGGRGSQDGGSLLRQMPVDVHVLYQLHLDPANQSEVILAEEELGLLDLFEKIKTIFSQTNLGTNPDTGTALVFERVYYVRESTTRWEEPTRSIVSRGINFSTIFGERLPGSDTMDAAFFARVT